MATPALDVSPLLDLSTLEPLVFPQESHTVRIYIASIQSTTRLPLFHYWTRHGMDTMETAFARVYKSWLKARGFSPTEGAPYLGVSRSVSFAYAASTALPCDTKVPALARVLNVPELRLKRTLEQDRRQRERALTATIVREPAPAEAPATPAEGV